MTRLILIAGLFLASIGTADAHAFVITANPAAGAVLKVAPSQVTITFTEALEPHFSSLTVEDSSGHPVDMADAHTAPSDGTTFSVGLTPLPPGSYKVVWHATSVDTHKTNGSYNFTIAP